MSELDQRKEKEDWVPEAKKPCDRCGRDIKRINNSITKNNTFIQFNDPKTTWIDLCDDCKEDLKQFLEIKHYTKKLFKNRKIGRKRNNG